MRKYSMLNGCLIFPALCAYAAPIANNSRLTLTSPNYPNNYESNTRCHWTISSEDIYTERLRIQFLDFDLADSRQCEDDYVEIIDSRVSCLTYYLPSSEISLSYRHETMFIQNRKYIEEGYGENFIWNGNMLTEIYDSVMKLIFFNSYNVLKFYMYICILLFPNYYLILSNFYGLINYRAVLRHPLRTNTVATICLMISTGR